MASNIVEIKLSEIDKVQEVLRKQNEEIERLNQENQQLKKQKDDVVEYIKYQLSNFDFEKDIKARMLGSMIIVMLEKNERMLGEIDVED